MSTKKTSATNRGVSARQRGSKGSLDVAALEPGQHSRSTCRVTPSTPCDSGKKDPIPVTA